MDVILVGHVIVLPVRLNSCMRAGIRAKKPLVMYSSKTCDDEMVAISAASLQVKARRPGHQRQSSCEDRGSGVVLFCDGGLSMTIALSILARIPG
jgi:hypothetical protein